MLLSKSGASDELFGLIEQLKRFSVPIITITGEPDSVLARQADVVLDAAVTEEACPETLAPTASTTAALALGDALAVALLEDKGFRRDDFAALHPGGALGRKLLVRVGDVMIMRDVPMLRPDRPMRECVVLLAKRRGTVAVVDDKGALVGVVTAGDLTRLMERTDRFLDTPVADVMTRAPSARPPTRSPGAAIGVMEQYGIMALPVLDGGASSRGDGASARPHEGQARMNGRVFGAAWHRGRDAGVPGRRQLDRAPRRLADTADQVLHRHVTYTSRQRRRAAGADVRADTAYFFSPTQTAPDCATSTSRSTKRMAGSRPSLTSREGTYNWRNGDMEAPRQCLRRHDRRPHPEDCDAALQRNEEPSHIRCPVRLRRPRPPRFGRGVRLRPGLQRCRGPAPNGNGRPVSLPDQ